MTILVDEKMRTAAEEAQKIISAKKGATKTMMEAIIQRQTGAFLSGRDTHSGNVNRTAVQRKTKSTKRRKIEKARRRRAKK